MALKAVRAMAKYGKDKDALWGIQASGETSGKRLGGETLGKSLRREDYWKPED